MATPRDDEGTSPAGVPLISSHFEDSDSGGVTSVQSNRPQTKSEEPSGRGKPRTSPDASPQVGERRPSNSASAQDLDLLTGKGREDLLGTPGHDSRERDESGQRHADERNSASPVTGDSLADADASGQQQATPVQPHGIACVIEVFQHLCSLLRLDDAAMSGHAFEQGDEDVPLFALGLVNAALEACAPCSSIAVHARLLSLVQDDLFRSLMLLGLSPNPLVVSLVCGVVFTLYSDLRSHLKLQIEAFFAVVISRHAQSKFGSSYQQQEVVLESVIDFCRQPEFAAEVYANYDCDTSSHNTLQGLIGLLSKNTFPVNSSLSTLHVLSLEGLLTIVYAIANRAITSSPSQAPPPPVVTSTDFTPFWNAQEEFSSDPAKWLNFIRRRKHLKHLLATGAELFNRKPKKGLHYLQSVGLLPKELHSSSEAVACFLRYTPGLNKTALGEYLGDVAEFHVQVLTSFTALFDFSGMTLDGALRIYLESFRLPGEAQKIARVLEAFAERYFEHSSHLLANKDTAYILSYSVIMLNTDQHNGQVRRKMTEQEFIRNNRNINDGADLPRAMLSELFHSIAKNEIRISGEASLGAAEMTYSRWVDLLKRTQTSLPYIVCSPNPILDSDLFGLISGPVIASLSVVFDHAEEHGILQQCADGFFAVARIAFHLRLSDPLDDLIISLSRFTSRLPPTADHDDDPSLVFGEDIKTGMAAVTLFTITHRFGDHLRKGWRNVVDCVLRLHKLGLLPPSKVSIETEVADGPGRTLDGKGTSAPLNGTVSSLMGRRRPSSGFISRFSQFLALDADDEQNEPTEHELAVHDRTRRTLESCSIHSIFVDSKFLHSDALLDLAKALIAASGKWKTGRPGGLSVDDEDTAIFCLDLLITVTLCNRDRISREDCPLWPMVAEHIGGIVQSACAPGPLVEKAVLGLLRFCQRLLPYKEDLADELLLSLHLLQKLDSKVADALCVRITQEVVQLLRANHTVHIRSTPAWQAVCLQLKITARHPEAASVGFEGLRLILANEPLVTPTNYGPCLEAVGEFADSWVGGIERSVWALDLMGGQGEGGQAAGLLACLLKWSQGHPVVDDFEGWTVIQKVDRESGVSEETSPTSMDAPGKGTGELRDMWLQLAHGIRAACGDQREEVRSHAVTCLQRCLVAAEPMKLPNTVWLICFDQIVFALLDDLLYIAVRRNATEVGGMEGTMLQALKLLSKVFLFCLPLVRTLPQTQFRKLWYEVLGRMEMYMKARVKAGGSGHLEELVPEILKNILLVMYAKGVFTEGTETMRAAEDGLDGGCNDNDSLWATTWGRVERICPGLKEELFPTPPPAPSSSPPPEVQIHRESEVLLIEGHEGGRYGGGGDDVAADVAPHVQVEPLSSAPQAVLV
eukprot:TRINITY_DN11653_c0_g1_i1.p1 TRINITY_DN11653_c0_g1~~TRINITY_DN11653_c0_g1_i1.p1  ORF type:complete len:1561 (-),score=232.21 TRINITY_DN11653_c0_g1_i1:253-4377(-)